LIPHRRVFEAVKTIPSGRVSTYGEVARAAGGSARSVGQAPFCWQQQTQSFSLAYRFVLFIHLSSHLSWCIFDAQRRVLVCCTLPGIACLDLFEIFGCFSGFCARLCPLVNFAAWQHVCVCFSFIDVRSFCVCLHGCTCMRVFACGCVRANMRVRACACKIKCVREWYACAGFRASVRRCEHWRIA